MAEIKGRCPRLANVPLVNDEADPEKSWWKSKHWRAGVEYPLAVARNILNHKLKYFNGSDSR